MRKINIILVALFILPLMLSGCMEILKPKPLFVGGPAENAPPEYKQGWADGCESGYSAYGELYYKTFYKFKQDSKMIDNPTYYKAWIDSFNYCRSYINRYMADGMWFGKGFDKSDDPNVFNSTGLNDDNAVESKWGLSFGVFEGYSLPGWGGIGYDGGNDSDWLGRDEGATDWLGRTKEYQ